MEIKAEPTLSGNGTTRSSSPIEFIGIPGMERDKDRATYLQQLIKDQKTCLSYPNVFHHVERLLAEGRNLTQCDRLTPGYQKVTKLAIRR